MDQRSAKLIFAVLAITAVVGPAFGGEANPALPPADAQLISAADPAGTESAGIATVDPQALIAAARPGATVTIPPGTYKKGIYIGKPLHVRMKGVRLAAPTREKGAVVVNAPGPVVLDGLIADVPPGCRTNCAGVRIEGRDYDVTIRNATILNQEMGVLTGNRGGRLIIEDSAIGDTGLNPQSDLSHVIYAGWSDELIIRGSRIHGSHNLGHLVKSRARKTVIENSLIVGGHSRHSRLVETPCGGELIITGSLLQQSENTDNPEFMMLGGASQTNCAGHDNWPVALTLRGNRLISHRDRSADEPARDQGETALMRYRGTNPPVVNQAGGNITLEKNENVPLGETSGPAIDVLWYLGDTLVPPPSVSQLQGQSQ